MSFVITQENLSLALAHITDRVLNKKTIILDDGDEDIFLNSPTYMNGVTLEYTDGGDFIQELKQRYDYPQT